MSYLINSDWLIDILNGIQSSVELIAATAITNDLALVTRNTRHFSCIPDLKLYQDHQ